MDLTCVFTITVDSVIIGACFSRVRPTPLTHPKLVAHSQPALDLLGLAPDQVEEINLHVYMYM